MIIEKIKEFDKIYILGHAKPDGDCYGSAFGLKHIIRANFNKEATVVLDECSITPILGAVTKPGTVDYKDSLVISVDTANSSRVSDSNFKDAKYIIKFDHHLIVDNFGDINHVIEGISSTCELVATWAFDNNLIIDKDAARSLYTGLTTDTNRFFFNATTSKTMLIASKLLETGFDMNELYERLYEKSFDQVNYMSFVYGNIKRSEKGILYLYITRDDIMRFNLTDEEASEAVGYMGGIKDHPIWVLFYETSDGKIRVRLRSNKYAVNEVANNYKGGGHKFASGATVTSIEEAMSLIKDLEEILG